MRSTMSSSNICLKYSIGVGISGGGGGREDFQVTSGDSKFCFLHRNSLEDEDWKGVAVPEVDGSLMTEATKGYGGGDALRLTMYT